MKDASSDNTSALMNHNERVTMANVTPTLKYHVKSAKPSMRNDGDEKTSWQ